VLFRRAASNAAPKVSVAVSLLAWFSVAMAGRMIGFI
jgi:hypothetical protein